MEMKRLRYWEMDCELWVSDLSEFDVKSVKRGVEIERGSCNRLGGWHCKRLLGSYYVTRREEGAPPII